MGSSESKEKETKVERVEKIVEKIVETPVVFETELMKDMEKKISQ